ncbi:dUTP diphosphatase [Paenibacillus oleatilyticus]|uniref:dUTP diphosphatase n=1 Tax=Paenibacillus oleatilyticus TaxID=2594886 RepID=UPI001C1FCB32|nr:dUTP diphosphatase [Paenibacillus oleatilyticus]MBU7319018.1 dUTP diphosphatase [Paenibacillus oleatilyticus]
MNLEKMYEMQKELDARIIKEKGLEGVDLLPNTVLALQVEIAELANEWRGFKHWSNDQEPRFNVLEIGVTDCSEEKLVNRVLEEYVDCLHFFLSIARQLDLPAEDLYVCEDVLEEETVVLFMELLHNVGLINGEKFLFQNPDNLSKYQRESLRAALFIFYNLGEQRLGFTFEQIVEAYVAKNAINHKRQSTGY